MKSRDDLIDGGRRGSGLGQHVHRLPDVHADTTVFHRAAPAAPRVLIRHRRRQTTSVAPEGERLSFIFTLLVWTTVLSKTVPGIHSSTALLPTPARDPFDGMESNPYLSRSFCIRGLMMKSKNSCATLRDAFRQVHTTACPNWTVVCDPAGVSSMMRTCPLLSASTR